MSIFSVFSRGGSSAPDHGSQGQAQHEHGATGAADGYYTPTDSPQPTSRSFSPATTAALDQLQGGVSELLGQVDFSSSDLNPVASPSGIEYLTLEDGPAFTGGVVPSRGWSDDLCYGTGT
ncbi:hypothetical protein IWQ56_003785, partial [Coemansia nantahalensis]